MFKEWSRHDDVTERRATVSGQYIDICIYELIRYVSPVTGSESTVAGESHPSWYEIWSSHYGETGPVHVDKEVKHHITSHSSRHYILGL